MKLFEIAFLRLRVKVLLSLVLRDSQNHYRPDFVIAVRSCQFKRYTRGLATNLPKQGAKGRIK